MSEMPPGSEPSVPEPSVPESSVPESSVSQRRVTEPPVAHTPPPPPVSTPASSGGWGPPGDTRNWLVVALLSIVTCGIYFWFWSYYVFRDNKEHSGEGVGGTVGVIFAILVGIVNLFLLPHEVGAIYEKAGQERPVSAVTGFWNLIPIVGSFIWLYKVQTAINTRWEQLGVAPA